MGAGEQLAVGVPIEVHRYRVMFADGDVRDYLAVRDDSTARGFMVEQHYGYKSTDKNAKAHPHDAIVGIADMGVELHWTPMTDGGVQAGGIDDAAG